MRCGCGYLTASDRYERVYEEIFCGSDSEWLPLPKGMDTVAASDNLSAFLLQGHLPNVWLGVSTEDQRRANERVPDLLATPAAIRFVSAEPLLGPLNLRRIRIAPDQHTMLDALDGYAIADSISCSGQERAMLDLVIVGGESGPNARPMHPDWARSLRDQCAAAGTAFFFKQWGEWLPGQNEVYPGFKDGRLVAHWQDGGWGPRTANRPDSNYVTWAHDGTMHRGERRAGNYFEVAAWAQRVGKKAAGRLLDGVQHNAMPEVRP